jgi:ABC-type branched-subunit amino acid transport system permease subunit
MTATLPFADSAKGRKVSLIGGRSLDYVVILLLQIGSAIASLVLMSIGLAVIFGMMRVINLAHGEFLMLGGYAAITAFNLGINLWVAMGWWRRSWSGCSGRWSSGW